MKYRGSLAGFIWGTLYALVCASIFSMGKSYSLAFLEFVSIAMLVISPISVGVVTVFFATQEQANNKSYRSFHPWWPVLGWSIISILFAWETIICIVMLLPLYLPLSSLGGAIGGYVRRNYCDKTNVGVVSCFSILPLLISPFETPIQSPELFHTVKNTVEINASIKDVWGTIPNIKDIHEEELEWNLSHFIGIPKPLSATTVEMKVGGIRDLSWERGVHFQERITQIVENEIFAYDVIVDQASMNIAELDTHIVVGDQYFDVVSGVYEFEEKNGKTYLSLSTRYRMTSKVNWYGSFWANYVLDDFHSSVLGLIKNRIENRKAI
ncbi:MAG: hypothetical protein OEY19_09945 [Gammaproteobacteria bacterium]|nr:hypothetical protein [Gammaproteobacteria bacterium]MDH5629808.1 hypothetical protein [Gammaproteobacteria bacterium]